MCTTQRKGLSHNPVAEALLLVVFTCLQQVLSCHLCPSAVGLLRDQEPQFFNLCCWKTDEIWPLLLRLVLFWITVWPNRFSAWANRSGLVLGSVRLGLKKASKTKMGFVFYWGEIGNNNAGKRRLLHWQCYQNIVESIKIDRWWREKTCHWLKIDGETWQKMKVKMELWVGRQEQKSIFSIKGMRNYFGKKYFYTTCMFSRHERWKHIGSYLGFSHCIEKANKFGGFKKHSQWVRLDDKLFLLYMRRLFCWTEHSILEELQLASIWL